MNSKLVNCIRQILLSAIVLAAVAANSARAQMIDLNTNHMSDVWELLYNVSNLSPGADDDGDGVSNLGESRAGTNPEDANSVPAITATALLGTNVNVSIPCALGKQYQLQSTTQFGALATNWITEATMVARSGTVATLSAPAGVATKFFRISISDVDSDGDGVNDWEEYKLGLDPFNAYSNGQMDGNGNAMNDYAYAVGKLAFQNVITITSSDPTAFQPDIGQTSQNPGAFTITRGGFPLRSLTVNLSTGPGGPGIATPGLDYVAFPSQVSFPSGLSSITLNVTPLANSNLLSSVIATLKLVASNGYTLGTASNASVVIYPTATPNGAGLTGQYYTNASATYSSAINFNPANLKMTRIDPTVDFVWGNTTTPIPNNGYYCVRWTGQIMPQYSEMYYFDAYTDDGVKVYVNDQLIIDAWPARSPADSIATVNLQAGVRYDVKMDYWQATGGAEAHLSWYSASQPKQVVPANRLFPTSVTQAPAAVTTPLNAYAFLGQFFSLTNTSANSAAYLTATGLPPGLNFNPANGVISGTPNLAGTFPVTITATNGLGAGGSVVLLQVIDTGSSVVREVWTGVPGTSITNIPLNTPATFTNTLGTLEGITGFSNNYAERIRGYITAPTTANYYFWLAASDAAELWISNDGEPVNKVRRAVVTSGTAPRQWYIQANQKSGWLSLVAGQRYYVEILHKAGTATNDNWSVGWLQDPTGTNQTAGGVVPGYVLGRYYPPLPSQAPGSLYSATLLMAPGASATASGSATLRVSADGSQAVLNFQYVGLSSAVANEWGIHTEPYLNFGSLFIYDLFMPGGGNPQPDGSYLWHIQATGGLQQSDILEILREGGAYLLVPTVNNPNGEILGNFTAVDGSQTFTAPPPAQSWTDDHTSASAAARFLAQATYGPSQIEISNVQSLGYAGWISNQFFNVAPTHHLPLMLANINPDPTTLYPGSTLFNDWWQISLTAPDQLRQRVAFALSEIMVVSDQGALQDNGLTLADYYDTLLDGAFGNFRALLKNVTLTSAMGMYLNMQGNDVGNIVTGLHANENYAREIQQLFSVGLYRMWPDGTLVMNSQGNLVPTYDQNVVMGFASVFTGWNFWQPNQTNGLLPSNWYPSADFTTHANAYTNPMVLVPGHHELGTKRLLDNVILPPAYGAQTTASSNRDAYCSQDLESAMDSIFNNQNVGPYICRQLIQRLVASNPSRDYLYRVVQAFNDDGTGTRGNMQAVINAILLDYEARSQTNSVTDPTFGKQREPLLRVTGAARALPPATPMGGTYTQGGLQYITNTTASPHRLGTGDIVVLNFSDASVPAQPAPAASSFYGITYGVTVLSSNSFRVTAPGLATGSYGQTNGTITVNMSSHNLAANYSDYLAFTTGGASNGAYQVVSVPDGNHFTVTTTDTNTLFGNCVMPRWSINSFNGGYVQSRTNVTVGVNGPHGLNPNDNVFIYFSYGIPTSGQYQVVSVPDATHFTIIATNSTSLTQNGGYVFPMVAPSLNRTGSNTLSWSTFNLGATDTGANPSLAQTPLNSPTVFNFFFPGYQFPGILAAAGLTTPEFQLSSDSTVAWQMNFLYDGLLGGNSGNTNGMSSFNNGGGQIVVDLGPWMTPAYTSNAGVPGLVDALSSLLTGNPLSSNARNAIVNYVTNAANFPTSSATYMRDRVRAVVHLLIDSPDYTVQR